MCGIAGILNFKNESITEERLRQMTCAMTHRGPDADGIFIDGPIGLGHRRLSIIDLSEAANQPFTDNSGRYIMVFNGEMYNFKQVKQQLKDYGFKTTSDTEVLIAAFAKWGPNCIHYFKGMFVFAIWDKMQKQLTVVRDRLGVKPLYFYMDQEWFLFASEIRSILAAGIVNRKVNKEALLEFFSYQSIGYPYSLIEGIEQLEAGSYIQVSAGKLEKHVYWDITKAKVDFDFTEERNIQKHIRELVSSSVERRLVSDVPVGAFLSGGIDSSVIVGLMAEVGSSAPNTFTVSFDEMEYDESRYADIIAKKFNTNHNSIHMKASVMLDELDNALNAMDTPSGDGINTYVVSKSIRNTGIKVALSGAGGDELFAGYPLFKQFLNLHSRNNIWKHTNLLRQLVSGCLNATYFRRKSRMQQILKLPELSIENIYPVSRQILSPDLLSTLTSLSKNSSFRTALSGELESKQHDIHRFPLLSQVSISEYLGYTQHTLLKDLDQMSMAASLEVREPYFDHDLVEFLLFVPDKMKYPVYPKSLLVESVKPLLPDEVVNRKKQGFLFPWNIWMKTELKIFCETSILNLSNRSFINGKPLIQYWRRFLKNDPSVRWSELWLFIVLEHWFERNNVQE